MATLNGMSESEFRKLAIDSVVEWWNENNDLVEEFGDISADDVYITWQCKAIENFKALLGVSFDGDGMYFEFTQHGAKQRCYLDCYKKADHITVEY